MQLQLDRIALRSWRPEDAPLMAPLADNYLIWRNVRDRFPRPYTVADAEAYIASALAQDPQCWFAITIDDKPIGAIGIIPKDDVNRICAEFGYWLGEPYWGKGYATEAAIAFSDWIFANRDIHRLEALVFTYHPASARVLEKAGFELQCTSRKAAVKEGEIRDEWLYAKVKP